MLNDEMRSEAQESLLHLYLRLNGYFVTGFIAHAAERRRNRTQIDALAVRHPFNREPRRQIGPSSFLSPNGTDVLICEVKSGRRPKFNRGLRCSDEAVRDVLAWVGLFDEEETCAVARALIPLLEPNAPAELARAGVAGPRGVTVRPLLSAPEMSDDSKCDKGGPWTLAGPEMFEYIGACLNPATQRVDCSIVYDPGAWGPILEKLVRYFKSRPPNNPGSTEDLYAYVEEEIWRQAEQLLLS